jgi:glycerophosphoryl diester phosphodiesterase
MQRGLKTIKLYQFLSENNYFLQVCKIDIDYLLCDTYKMKKIITRDHWLLARPISHRGLHDKANGIPENSLRAFEESCRKGYPIELDVRVTRDGKAAVFHDMTLMRMTGIHNFISIMDSKKVHNIKLLNTDEHIPMLDEVLDLVKGRVPVLIEIKRNLLPGVLENAVLRAVKSYKGEFAILSFNPVALRYIHENAPDHISGINIGRAEKHFFTTSFFNNFIHNYAHPQFISYSMNGLPPTFSAKFFKDKNLPVLAWTVSSESDEKKARAFADNIIFEGYTPK